jgi:hypothetical protein
MKGLMFSLPVLGLTALPGFAHDVPKCNVDYDVAAAVRSEGDDEDASPPAGGSSKKTITTGCGLGTTLSSTLRGGWIRVSFGNSDSRDFYPILLTDKKDKEWSCNKIKVRTACVMNQQPQPDGNVNLLLKVRNSRTATQETVTVRPDGTVSSPLGTKHFVLLSRFKMRSGESVDRIEGLLGAADQARCIASSSRGTCFRKRNEFVERATLYELRRTRLPKTVTAAQRAQDGKDLLALTNNLAGDERRVHLAIAASEIGWTPQTTKPQYTAFEILDAVLGNSGPSYGIHQIDIATNGSADVIPFRKIVPAALAKMDANAAPLLRASQGPTETTKMPIEKPMRGWSIALKADFYRAVPHLVEQLRTDKFRSDYLVHYRSFLKSSAGCMALLRSRGGLFASSKVAQLYVIDVDNQFGSGRARDLAQFALTLDPGPHGVSDAEERMMVFMKTKTPYGQSAEGGKDVVRRFGNIRKIAGDAPAGASGSATDCKLSSVK